MSSRGAPACNDAGQPVELAGRRRLDDIGLSSLPFYLAALFTGDLAPAGNLASR